MDEDRLGRFDRGNMHANAVSHARTRGFHGLVCEMSVARSRLHLCVTEQLAE